MHHTSTWSERDRFMSTALLKCRNLRVRSPQHHGAAAAHLISRAETTGPEHPGDAVCLAVRPSTAA
ncbi:MAG: hypothetical protein J07HR59_00060 [Halorubrum sp. J07HR59]|nr:MAG: hypothetical protein J07HR59_00060 [Halorubrum sp. J07HR59]